jgi:hypothetical protein
LFSTIASGILFTADEMTGASEATVAALSLRRGRDRFERGFLMGEVIPLQSELGCFEKIFDELEGLDLLVSFDVGTFFLFEPIPLVDFCLDFS